jgi:hypothetical protein
MYPSYNHDSKSFHFVINLFLGVMFNLYSKQNVIKVNKLKTVSLKLHLLSIDFSVVLT